MTDSNGPTTVSTPVRIPADVEREDKVLAGLTGRQLLFLAATGLVLYAMWGLTRSFVPVWAFLLVAVPIGAGVAVVVLGSRDGVSLDRLLLAAVRQRLAPRRRVTAPDGVRPAPAWMAGRPTDAMPTDAVPAELELPVEGITDSGVVDLGGDGLAVVAVCSTVNFSLRTQVEQDSLVACFGRYLHSLTAPVQVLVRTERLDLSAQIGELQEHAPRLPHPALEEAALEHSSFLAHLGEQTDLLRRQVLLVLREPMQPTASEVEPARRAGEARLLRRLNEAGELLAPAGVTVRALDAGQAATVLAHACNPGLLLALDVNAHRLAGADDIITTTASPSEEDV